MPTKSKHPLSFSEQYIYVDAQEINQASFPIRNAPWKYKEATCISFHYETKYKIPDGLDFVGNTVVIGAELI